MSNALADKENLENTRRFPTKAWKTRPSCVNETRLTKIAADANAGRRCSQSRGRGYLG